MPSYKIPCLDGSTRELETLHCANWYDGKGRNPYPFSATQPAVGRYFVFHDCIFLRMEDPEYNVLRMTKGSFDEYAVEIDSFVFDEGAIYRPIDIWTGNWL